MELDKLKLEWRELDERLSRAETQIRCLNIGKQTSSKQKLMRIFRLKLAMLLLLPSCFVWVFRMLEQDPGTVVYVLLGLFITAMIIRQILLLAALAKINPATMTVRDICEAVLRLRKYFLAGVVAGVVFAVPLFVALGIFFSKLMLPEGLYGFVIGLFVGIVSGVKVFMRILSEINSLSEALQNNG